MITYFVSYIFGVDAVIGYGNASVDMTMPITSIESTKSLAEKISQIQKIENVVVMNWRRFEPVSVVCPDLEAS